GDGEFTDLFAVLDERVQVHSGVGVERRGENAAVAERARAELHAAVHPGDDLVFLKLGHGGRDQFVDRDHVVEVQLAVFEYLLDFAGIERGTEERRFHGDAFGLAVGVVPRVEYGANRAARVAGDGL